MRLAKATPKSDIESRIPAANTQIRIRSVVSGAAPMRSPKGASNVSARRLLTANAAPMSVGTCECAPGTVPIAASDVQVPVRRRLASVPMVWPSTRPAPTPETNRSKSNEQQSAEHLAAAFNKDRQRPTQQDDGACPQCEQQRMSDGKAKRDAQSARALYGRGFRAGADRQRSDSHQVIGTEAMQESEREGGREKDERGHCGFFTS